MIEAPHITQSNVTKDGDSWFVVTPSQTQFGPYAEEVTAQNVGHAFDLANESMDQLRTRQRSSRQLEGAAADLTRIIGASIATRRLQSRAEILRCSETTWD